MRLQQVIILMAIYALSIVAGGDMTEPSPAEETSQPEPEDPSSVSAETDIPSVLVSSANVSCGMAESICLEDGECSTSFDYYHKYCRAMFRRKTCSKRCLNAINILMRQEKARLLKTCVCDTQDTYCATITRNRDELCFDKPREHKRLRWMKAQNETLKTMASSQESSTPNDPSSEVDDTESFFLSCEEARKKCVFNSGCHLAFQNYTTSCAGILYEPNPDSLLCPVTCHNALVALTSFDEGKDFMKCDCTDEDCQESKKKMEVCWPLNSNTASNESSVSCGVAKSTCLSDEHCSKSLDYYHKYCKGMFRGKKCSKRCFNSITILMRQEKAKLLKTCVCDPNDKYCSRIKRNRDKLCFKIEPSEE